MFELLPFNYMGAPAHLQENTKHVLKDIVSVYDAEHAIGINIIGTGIFSQHVSITCTVFVFPITLLENGTS